MNLNVDPNVISSVIEYLYAGLSSLPHQAVEQRCADRSHPTSVFPGRYYARWTFPNTRGRAKRVTMWENQGEPRGSADGSDAICTRRDQPESEVVARDKIGHADFGYMVGVKITG